MSLFTVGWIKFFFLHWTLFSFVFSESPVTLLTWNSSLAVNLFAGSAVTSFSVSSSDDSKLFAEVTIVKSSLSSSP